MPIKWLAQTTIYRNSVDLLAVIDRGNGDRDVMEPTSMMFRRQNPDELIERPSLELDHQSARSLMQALWDAGVRPADLGDSSGEIRALKAHVEFAQKIAGSLIDRGA